MSIRELRRLSLRSLLLAAVLGTMTIGFVALAVYIDRIERENRMDDIDVELVRAERSGLQPDAGNLRAPTQAPPDTEDAELSIVPPVQLLVRDGTTVAAANGVQNPFDATTIAALVAVDGTQTVDEPRYRVRTTTNPAGDVALTALPLDEFDDAVSRFRVAIATGGGVILAFVTMVLWAVTGYLARPVTRMAATANRIAEGHLSTAVDPPSGSRETAELSLGLHVMLTRLRTALDDATEARDAMERFLADMAHEIRTPLTALKGYSDLYRGGMLEAPADVDRAMLRIGSESERLSNLANTMLQLAGDRSTPPPAEAFDIVEVVDEVASDLRAAYPDQEIEIRLGGHGSIEVLGARAEIHQAILNLGSNACHHSPESSPIEIDVAAADRSVNVKVIDHGVGVDPDDAARIFRPFYRSETARSRSGQHGAGLGLALAKQITERHDGTLAISTTPGGGATFTLELPLR